MSVSNLMPVRLRDEARNSLFQTTSSKGVTASAIILFPLGTASCVAHRHGSLHLLPLPSVRYAAAHHVGLAVRKIVDGFRIALQMIRRDTIILIRERNPFACCRVDTYVTGATHVAYLLGEHLYATPGVGGGQTAEHLQLRLLPRTVAHGNQFPILISLSHDIANYVGHIVLTLVTGHDD